jgi:hypothetical protein
MPLRHRVPKHVLDRYKADRELAGTYREKLAAAGQAEQDLREAQMHARSDAEVRGLSKVLDAALLDALRAAEAAERVAMGTKVYPASEEFKDVRAAQIAYRKALARADVRPWTDEVDRVRTAREALKLSFRAVARV